MAFCAPSEPANLKPKSFAEQSETRQILNVPVTEKKFWDRRVEVLSALAKLEWCPAYGIRSKRRLLISFSSVTAFRGPQKLALVRIVSQAWRCTEGPAQARNESCKWHVCGLHCFPISTAFWCGFFRYAADFDCVLAGTVWSWNWEIITTVQPSRRK